MAVFPAGSDNITESISPSTPQSGIHSSLHNQIADALNAVQAELLSGGSMSMEDHLDADNPHPQYLTQDEADARYIQTASATGVDSELRAYIQTIMAILDPGGPPPPPP